MPSAPLQYCATPGCPRLVPRGRCLAHARDAQHARPNYAIRRWYRTARWKALRAQVVRDQAYRCAMCGTLTLTLEVDHIRKHQGNPLHFWQRANLQALCGACHARKTRRGA